MFQRPALLVYDLCVQGRGSSTHTEHKQNNSQNNRRNSAEHIGVQIEATTRMEDAPALATKCNLCRLTGGDQKLTH
jgi:hypothetical protein